jgi:hypothetical protein
MRFIPTTVHGAIDHVVAPALLAAPEIFRLDKNGADGIVPRAVGGAAAVYSNLTDYELSLKRLIPMKAHLALDGMSGAFLAASPWLLGYRRKGLRHWLPHTVVGVAEVALALTTKTEPASRKRKLAARLLPG